MSEMNHVPLSRIRDDGGTQMRTGIDANTVTEYADHYRDDTKMPPVVVFHDGENYWLADGFHRLQALRAANKPNALCEIRRGTRRDAVLFACGANKSHGLRRTNADKRRAVEAMLRDEEWNRWTDGRIARQCGVSQQFVSSLRKASHNDCEMQETRLVERNGKVYEQNTANIGKRKRHEQTEAPAPYREGCAPKRVEDESTYDPGEDAGDVELFDVSGLTDTTPAPIASSPAFTFDERRMREFRTVSAFVAKGLAYLESMQSCPQLAEVEDSSTRKMLENMHIKIAAFHFARLPKDASTQKPVFRVIDGGSKPLGASAPPVPEKPNFNSSAVVSAIALSGMIDRIDVSIREQLHHFSEPLDQTTAERLRTSLNRHTALLAELRTASGVTL
jgi:hypothetical protein